MSQIQVRTRGGSAPTGKPKVYISCHPDDFVDLFDGICDDVLNMQNCAVYYKLDPSAPTDDELAFDLRQMNLFIVPVTSRLLSEDSPTAETDVPLAQSQHIPVLPIMQEPGLYRMFTKLFGKVQYLKRYETDPTEIPYKEKLATFLSAVIVGDELANKVRAAFDAYIFLSYRKKDRRQAQKLMELIHANDFCRDVAIWYDEYLTPGEDFNDLIAQALEKSDLFALAVTPNLVNEVNYVMNIEYPMARESGKPIVPVEMATTSREDLRNSYEDLPEPVSAEDAAALGSLIMGKLGQIKLSRGDDPSHRFFIGLAYLQGIDVEKNVETGLAMITEAAKAGLPEAMDKLANMHYYGDGVGQDYKKAIEWQKRLADKYADIAEESRADKDMVPFIAQRIRCGEMEYGSECYLEAAGSFANAYEAAKALAFGMQGDGILQKMAGIARRFTSKTRYLYDAAYYMTRSARMAMQAYGKAGLADDAAKWGKRAVTFGKPNSMFEGEERSARELVAAYGTMGMLCLDSGNLAGAREAFAREADMISEINGYDAAVMDAHASLHLFLLAEAEGDIKKAADYGNYAIGRTKVLYEEFKMEPEGWALFPELFALYIRMSRLCWEAGALGDANMALDDAWRLLNADGAHASADMLDHLRSVATLHRGRILLDSGKPSEAKMLLLEIAGSMHVFATEESISFDSLDDASFAYECLGDCCAALGEYVEAADWQEKACVDLHDNMALTRSIRATKRAASGFEKLFDRYIDLSEPYLARQWYDKAEWCLNAVSISTKLVSDANELARLRSKESLLALVESENRSVNNYKSLGQYVLARADHIDDMYPDFMQTLEASMGKLMMEFVETHRLFGAAPEVFDLGRTLSGGKLSTDLTPIEIFYMGLPIEIDLSADAVDSKKRLLPGKIAKAMMDSYNTFIEYDEMASLITSYCGFCDLISAWRVIGGRDKALTDFKSFFESRPFWDFPLDKIQYRETWLLVFCLVEEKHRC